MKKKKTSELESLAVMDEMSVLSAIMNTMRVLKPLNYADTFYENYIGMVKRYQPFFDSYMLIWNIGAKVAPRKVLEIGARTGISACQLFSAYLDTNMLEKAVLIDPFLDGFSNPSLILKNLQYLNLPYDKRITIHVARSNEQLPLLIGETFNYILVDGDHSKEAARTDLENIVPLCERGTIVCCDDLSTSPGECGLIDVWESWTEAHKEEFVFSCRMEGKGVGWAIKT